VTVGHNPDRRNPAPLAGCGGGDGSSAFGGSVGGGWRGASRDTTVTTGFSQLPVTR
jgi:hypothetical protein